MRTKNVCTFQLILFPKVRSYIPLPLILKRIEITKNCISTRGETTKTSVTEKLSEEKTVVVEPVFGFLKAHFHSTRFSEEATKRRKRKWALLVVILRKYTARNSKQKRTKKTRQKGVRSSFIDERTPFSFIFWLVLFRPLFNVLPCSAQSLFVQEFFITSPCLVCPAFPLEQNVSAFAPSTNGTKTKQMITITPMIRFIVVQLLTLRFSYRTVKGISPLRRRAWFFLWFNRSKCFCVGSIHKRNKNKADKQYQTEYSFHCCSTPIIFILVR
uniref:Type II restriction enzyme CeqI n=1 Tax=Rhodococcus hoagii TaxID=43767 RepID=T2C1_RHOHA|nr:RecName: Full=Type II restriction enzyme CeqI; Short=R.CeqI; AltName: Full=Endonuclease CeqI; AltName: Full=Type-2 restriction enzyme CeqI [Prescottella equi]CAA84005.1 hypothetical protein [Prescottella equi]